MLEWSIDSIDGNKVRQWIYRAGVPILVVVGVWYLLKYISLIPEAYLEILTVSPFVLLLVVVAFTYRFNHARLLIIALTLLVVYWSVWEFLQQSLETDLARYIYTAIGLMLPLNVLLTFAMCPERGIAHWSCSFMALLIPLEILGLWLGWQGWFNLPGVVTAFATDPFNGFPLSLQATLWFELVFIACLGLAVLRRPNDAMAMLLCLVAVFVMLAGFNVPHISVVMTSATSLMLLVVPLNHAYDMAYRDDLTGVLGRRALEERMSILGSHYVIAMLDIDHFKAFNDTYGHDTGDDVLKLVASHLSRIGAGGIPYRYGGDEFTLLFPDADLKLCQWVLEDLRCRISRYEIRLRNHKTRPLDQLYGAWKRGAVASTPQARITVSIGFAACNELLSTPAEVLKAADKALYQAKAGGRNDVIAAPSAWHAH